MNNICVIFDLDDTLYKEIDYLRSAYRFISERIAASDSCPEDIYQYMLDRYINGEDVFGAVQNHYSTARTKSEMLVWYRTHIPDIRLTEDTKSLLNFLKEKEVITGILTDGRSHTQRNKIEALGLKEFIVDRDILISEEFGSEKPSADNYRYFELEHPTVNNFIYVGDNPNKDFLSPNRLGWLTIGLRDKGDNIHNQTRDNGFEYQPKLWVDKLSDMINFFDNNQE